MHTTSEHPVRVTGTSRLAAALTVVVLVLVGLAGSASAHGVEGEMTMTKLEQTGPTTVHVEVGIVYDGDQDPAEDATVEATLTDVDGNAVGPTDLPRVDDQSSLYAADIEVTGPGTWSVDVSSTEPSGAATALIEVVAQDGTTPGTETTEVPGPDGSSTTLADEDPDDQVMTANGTTEDDAGDAEDDATDETSNGAALIVLAVAAVVLIVGAGVVVWMRRGDRSGGPTDTSTTDTSTTDTSTTGPGTGTDGDGPVTP